MTIQAKRRVTPGALDDNFYNARIRIFYQAIRVLVDTLPMESIESRAIHAFVRASIGLPEPTANSTSVHKYILAFHGPTALSNGRVFGEKPMNE